MDPSDYDRIDDCTGLTSGYDQEIFPGHFWRHFNLEGGAYLLLTEDFLFSSEAEKTEILNMLDLFLDSGNIDLEEHGIGSKIGEGTEGKVFTLGDRYALKVMTKVHSDYGRDYPARMRNVSILKEYLHRELPVWLEFVPTYLYLEDVDGLKYAVMPKIGSGVTYSDLSATFYMGIGMDQRSNLIRRDFHTIGVAELNMLTEQYLMAEKIIRRMVSQVGDLVFDLEDFGDRNIIVTPLEKPIDGFPYKLWIIDQ